MEDTIDIHTLIGDPKNPRKITDVQFAKLKQTLEKFGDLSGIIKNMTTGELVGGHMRVKAFQNDRAAQANIQITQRFEQPTEAGTLAIGNVVVNGEPYGYREVQWTRPMQRAANLAANHAGGEDDIDLLAEVVYELSQDENAEELLALTSIDDADLSKLLGMVSGDGDDSANEPKGNLADDFIAPPFSILDTKQGYWQSRKRAWLDLGIQSEIGRKEGLLGNDEGMMAGINGGTSVFDPVLCEIAYRWFNVEGGTVLDPFAGGSVRGIIANKVGQQYIGLELRTEQVEANRQQALSICSDPHPVWIEGDSNKTLDAVDTQVDMIMSCPPYADLEVYSDDPDDLSNMPYPKFLEFYQSIITKACNKLKQDRFAFWVIGEVRGKDGNYYNFVGDTINCFKNAGLSYYNEMILVNTAGTLPMRAAKVFNSGRKIGKQHQNVLVFYKGDPRNIGSNFQPLDFSKMEDLFTKDGQTGELTGKIPEDQPESRESYLTE